MRERGIGLNGGACKTLPNGNDGIHDDNYHVTVSSGFIYHDDRNDATSNGKVGHDHKSSNDKQQRHDANGVNGFAGVSPANEALTVAEGENEDADDGNTVPPFTPMQAFWDPANICTLAGAIFAVIAMACMWSARYNMGLMFNVLANIMDLVDGQVARAMGGRRHPGLGRVGAKLDTHTDIVSHCIVPGSLLIRLSDNHPACIALVAMWVVMGIMRQSFFEVAGRIADNSCVFGVGTDYMPCLAAIVMHVHPIVGSQPTVLLMAATVLIMVLTSLSYSFRTRRFSGFGSVLVCLYNFSLAVSCFCLMLRETLPGHPGWVSFEGASCMVHLVLAYPLYFKYIEINK